MQSRIAFALVALSVLVHWPAGFTWFPGPTGPAAHVDFVYDDVDFVRANASIRSIDGVLPAMLAAFPPHQPERGLYRPVVALSHAIDFSAYELEPFGHHVTNVLLYGVVVWLVFGLASVWFGAQSWTAAAAGLLFAMHPVHCDAVDTVSGRSELLALAFALGSLLLFLRATPAGDESPRRGLGLGSALLYLLACGSKETAVLLPGVLMLHLLARDGASADTGGPKAFIKRALDRTSLHWGIALIYLAVRIQVLDGFGPAEPVLAGVDPLARAATMGTVFAEYGRLLIWPGVLQPDFYYQQAIGIPQSPTVPSIIGWLGVGVLGLGLGAAALGALRGGATSLASPRGLWIAGVGSAFVFLLPVSHLLAIGALMAERFLFAPSVGFVLFGTGLASHLLRARMADARRRRWIAAVLVAAIGLAGGVRSGLRASEWRDGVKLWESLAALTPGDYRPYSNIATQWIARGEFELAEEALRTSLALEQGDPAVNTNLAVVLLQRGELDAAESIHRQLLEVNPNDYNAHHNLGVIDVRRDQVASALGHFERALAINPNFEPARAQSEDARRRVDAARRYLHQNRVRAKTSRDPDFLTTYQRACKIANDPCKNQEPGVGVE